MKKNTRDITKIQHSKKKIKKKSIRTTLFAGFVFPVLMIVVLGVVSYATASQTIMKKYEDSALNTVTAMSMYGETLTTSIASKALEQVNNADMKEYYENYYSNTDVQWIEYYGDAKSMLLQMYNSTSYVSNYYVVPENGLAMSSLKTDLDEGAYSRFMNSDIGKSFAEKKSLKNGWFGYHTLLDAENNSGNQEYAFAYVQKFLSTNVFLVLEWSLESAEEMLEQIDFGKESITALVSADGKEIARIRTAGSEGSDTLETLEEDVFLAADFYEKSVELQEATSDYVTWNGESYLYVYAPLGNSGIGLCGLIPQKNIVAEVSTIRNLTVFIVILASVMAILVGNYLASGISKTVNLICTSLGKIAKGDLTQKVDVKRKDEFGELGHVLNDTIENIRMLMMDMKRFGRNVNRMADDISERTEAFNESIQNISVGVGEFANGLQVQVEETDKSNDKMREFAERLNDIHVETVQMSGSIHEATEAIHQGQIIIKELNGKAQTTASITDVLVENVSGVQKQSIEIEGIIDTINSIAEQTNLLSLNASIEAARAGEHGRGFAVVAEEIRKLAEQSAGAASEVQQRLSSMAVMAEKTTRSAEETQSIVASQGASLNQTIAVFGVIEERVEELVNGLQVIVGGMGQINTDKDEIQMSVKKISTETENAAASTQEVTATLDEQVGVIAKIAENMEYLKKEIGVLEKSIDSFKIQ